MDFRKSSYSGQNGSCVEVGSGDQVLVRDTTQAKDPSRTVISFTADAWSEFLGKIK
jgi:hypothetical protein